MTPRQLRDTTDAAVRTDTMCGAPFFALQRSSIVVTSPRDARGASSASNHPGRASASYRCRAAASSYRSCLALQARVGQYVRPLLGKDSVRFEHGPSTQTRFMAGPRRQDLNRAPGASADGAGHEFLERYLAGTPRHPRQPAVALSIGWGRRRRSPPLPRVWVQRFSQPRPVGDVALETPGNTAMLARRWVPPIIEQRHAGDRFGRHARNQDPGRTYAERKRNLRPHEHQRPPARRSAPSAPRENYRRNADAAADEEWSRPARQGGKASVRSGP